MADCSCPNIPFVEAVSLLGGSGASSVTAASSEPGPFFLDLLLEFFEAALVSGGAAPGGRALP